MVILLRITSYYVKYIIHISGWHIDVDYIISPRGYTLHINVKIPKRSIILKIIKVEIHI